MSWKKSICRCGLGEQHYCYDRSDAACVTHDHGMSGDKLSKSFIGYGPYGCEAITGYRLPENLMKKIDQLFPVEKEAV